MFGWLKKPVQERTVEVDLTPVDADALEGAGLRLGMWVMTSEGVGIITGAAARMFEVTMVKSDGSNLMVLDSQDRSVVQKLFLMAEGVRQATQTEIPISRRLPSDLMSSLGYIEVQE